jgi:hypothetical protein
VQIVTGIVLLLKFCLAGIVGVRLLRLPSEGWFSPERCLGWFFLIADVAGGVLITIAYGIWSSQGVAESTGVVNQLHGFGQLALLFGYAMVMLFTQRTFFADSKAALAICWAAIAVMATSLLGRVFVEGFAIGLTPGAFHWMGYYGRFFALACACVTGFAYWMQMKRRVALGLADPMVTNRFLLWGLWAFGGLLMACSEPVARFFYSAMTGIDAAAAQSIQQVGGELITITLCITSVLASITCVLLFLAFFPTDTYKSWILRRATAQQT